MSTIIEGDCTYCRGSDFFDNPSNCACEEFTGFFGDCSDYSFGLTPYETKRQCEYDSEYANTYFILLVTLLPVLGLLIYLLLLHRRLHVFLKNRNTHGAGPSTGGWDPPFY